MDEKKSYEEAVKELEEIVKLLEEGDIPLEKSLALFQKGIGLSKYCSEKLDETEKQIVKLMEEDGALKEVSWMPEEQK